MDLGDPAEARVELARVSAPNQHHPDVLEIRWALHANAKDWDAALMIAEILITHHPNEPQGWIHRAYALRRTAAGGIEKARAALLPAVQLFPQESVIPYNLSCYDAQTGRLEDAWLWLQKAMRVGGNLPIKRMALADSDLEPLWDRIRKTGV